MDGSFPGPDWRSLFARLREGAVARELGRVLPRAEIRALARAGLTAARVPRAEGGGGLSIPDFFELLIDLAEADSNLVQALRAHFGFVEHILSAAAPERRAVWTRRLAEGAVVGGAWSEVGEAAMGAFSTRLEQTPEGWRLSGTKYYTTGSLFADWIHVGATLADGGSASATVRIDAPGVSVLDDWTGMGQRLTASGTARFEAVPVDAREVAPEEGVPFAYSEAFFQLVHLATLAGIARAAAGEVAAAVGARRRTYSTAAAMRPAEDPQVLQVVGRMRAAAFGAQALVRQAAPALERAVDAVLAGNADPGCAVAEADLAVWQAQLVVTDLVLDSTAIGFDALGASATRVETGLDRHWRNARTLSSHNPRIYKARIVGDHAVNGTPPPGQWRIGIPPG